MGFPSKLVLAKIRRAYLSKRGEKHTLLMTLDIFIYLVTRGVFSCLHAAESLASKQVGSDGLCFAARYNHQCHFLNINLCRQLLKKGPFSDAVSAAIQ